MRGLNRNTGVEIDNWGCAISFLPMLLIENAAQTRGAAAATEDARNHIVDALGTTLQTVVEAFRGIPPHDGRLIEG